MTRGQNHNSSKDLLVPASQVRGHSAAIVPAEAALVAIASLTDAGFVALAGALFMWGFELAYSPLPLPAGIYGGCSLIFYLAKRYWLDRTPGLALWSIQRKSDGSLVRRQAPSSFSVASATTLTLLSIFLSFTLALNCIQHHPVTAEAALERLEASLPEPLRDWVIEPAYYSLGAWPKRFRGKPIFHVLPYEKGPPKRFPGRIRALWNPPDTVLTLEGPKTPDAFGRVRLRDCFRAGFFKQAWSGCQKVRNSFLDRHLDEMRGIGLSRWEIAWFVVRHPALGAEDLPQGIRMRGWNAARGQERYIFVTPKGSSQAVILDYSPEDSLVARTLLRQAIQSQKLADDLAPGRAWADRELQEIRLSDLKSMNPGNALEERLAEIQRMLIAKISVQPAGLDAYFHLGGTSFLLLRKLVGAGTAEPSQLVRPMIQLVHAAYLYAADVAPSDPRVEELKGHWIDAKKEWK